MDRVNSALRRVPTWPLYPLGLLPAALYFYWAVSNQLGADPLRVLEHELGETALQLMILVLLVTPVRNLAGLNLLRFRRAFGLLAFSYVVLHFLTYLVLDQQLVLREILQDLLKRPYIMIGTAAFLAMVPLAITSNDASVRRLGALAWRKLHRLTYFAAIAGAVHYLLLVKSWPAEPMVYLAVVVALVGYRYFRRRRRRSAK